MFGRAVLFAVLLSLAAGAAQAGVHRVEQDGSGDHLLIQDAVDAAADGDTILIGPGRYDDLQPRGDNDVVCVARWDDNRDLTFIGEDAATVIIGPTSYEPDGTGPQGIHQHEPANVRIENLAFENLKAAVVAGRGFFVAEGARFSFGNHGLFVQYPDSCIVRNCSFLNYDDHAIGMYNSSYVLVEDCDFVEADIYFGNIQNGIVRRCTATGNLVHYYLSEGIVEHCEVRNAIFLPCISLRTVTGPSMYTVQVRDNVLQGGGANLYVVGSRSRMIAERNSFAGPNDWDMLFDLGDRGSLVARNNHIDRAGSEHVIVTNGYPAGNDAVIDLGSNYWFDDGTPARLDSLIHDGHDDPELHIFVNYDPILTEPVPAEKSSFGGVKALFR